MAQWATYVMIGQSTYANAFHAAGGRYAVVYTNANYWYTSPTYTAPGNYSESSFAHTSSGARVSRPQGTGTEYYLNPNSSGSQSGYAAITNGLKNAGGYNYVYADGVSSDFSTSLYRFSGTPVEITTQSQYTGGMKKLMTMSPLPELVNGYMNGSPTQEEEYVGSTNIAGVFGESCFTERTYVVNGQKWLDMANGLIYTTTHHYSAVCGGRGNLSDNRPLRKYWLTSWWLTYDPTYSVALEIMTSTGSVYVFPEQELVPTGPLTTATTSIGDLRTSTGAYAREFSMCYLKGVALNRCVAIVNPTSSTVSIPPLKLKYYWTLQLDGRNLYDGGAVTWTKGVPTSLAPGTGVVLFG